MTYKSLKTPREIQKQRLAWGFLYKFNVGRHMYDRGKLVCKNLNSYSYIWVKIENCKIHSFRVPNDDPFKTITL